MAQPTNEERRTHALYAAALFLGGRGLNATQVIDTAQAFESYLRSGDNMDRTRWPESL